jgi:GT2 family glycosyltransferase
VTDDQRRIDELEEEVEQLRRSLERQRQLGRRTAQDARALGQRYRDVHDRLAKAQQDLKGLRARRSVRLALDMSRKLAAVRRRLGPTSAPSAHEEEEDRPSGAPTHRAATVADEQRFRTRAAAILASSPAPPTTGPLVSIVMLNRDGAAHLRRCLPALAVTAYRDVELIVIDNASTDASLAVLDAYRPAFDVRVIRNDTNVTFSEGNDQGVAEARGEFVLFLNNDVEPLEPGWLGRMVETAGDPDVVAVGARLIYPRRTDQPLAGAQFADLSLQHGGVAFKLVDGAPLPVPLGAGGDALSDWATAVRDVPALTAACLLVRRSALAEVGGFSDGYVYGHEDVDLCLKLRDRGGRLVYDGRAALWHHESSTRNLEEREARMARTVANRDLFVGRWAPRVYRTVVADALGPERFWSAEPFRLGTVGEPGAIDGLRGREWTIQPVDPAQTGPARSPDAILVTDPSVDPRRLPRPSIRIAWLGPDLHPWAEGTRIDDYDIVVARDLDAATSIGERSRKRAVVVGHDPDADGVAAVVQDWLAARRVGIRIAVPSWDVAERWGDLHFARDIQRAMEHAGHPTRIHLRPEWDAWWAARDDVGLHLLGRDIAKQRPGRIEVLWHISHPDSGSDAAYAAHDLAFVASDSFATWMDGRVDVPVRSLHQATDPRRFAPGATGPHHELLFVANSRGVRRHIIDDLLPIDHELAVYGKAWTPERLDQQYVAGEHIPNDRLGGYYASADIVLNDHWPDMQREGFLSNRLYDASAAGAFVITDGADGLEAEFDGGVVAYEDAPDLHRLIDRFLDDPAARAAHAARARAAVLARHTFEHRVRELFEHLGPLLDARQAALPEQRREGPIGEPVGASPRTAG